MDKKELRPALYHRLYRLLPFVAPLAARRFWRVLGWLALAVYFAFAALVLTLRYSVLPDIERYRPAIEQVAGDALGQPVRIGRITAGWDGLHPDLTLTDVSIVDPAGQPALAFSRIEAVLGWSSLWHLQLRLSLLSIDEPVLHVRREADGGFVVGGLRLGDTGGDSDMADVLLGQRRIRINGATIVWEDEKRAAPPLVLEDVNFALDNDGSRHRFGLTALPPAALASRLDIRGDLRGDDLSALDDWAGRVFAQLDFVDLAGWNAWFDYPVALPQGRGGMRAWVSLDEGRLVDLVADLALDDVHLRLARNLPEIRLDRLSGRLGAKLGTSSFAASGKGVTLALRDGTALPATDFSVDWQGETLFKPARGSASASRLDLALLARLSNYLPLDAATRKLLADYAPTGEIGDLRVAFTGDADALKTYSLRGSFHRLGLQAQGYFPGFSGFSGSIEASDTGGSVSVRAQQAGLDLPTVFPEPHLAFDKLAADAKWKIDGGKVDVELGKVEFSGADASGSAQGRYRYAGDGPGSIDLTATLSRADGRAVWKYMPHAVNPAARTWLKRGITRGTASDARLTLKGDLAKFPFLDGSGTFLVTAKAHDATVDYAPGWPIIEHIDGDLRFAGAGMHIDAKRGMVLGARVGATIADIADFDAADSRLTVSGKVEGPTAEFLRFIEASPVGEALDHATAEMRATGDGQLALALDIPLANAEATAVKGEYRFVDNQIVVEPMLPPMTQVNGVLSFTENGISAREITGNFLGGPARARIETQNGLANVMASGTINAAQARRQYDMPLFDYLSGSTGWRADVRVRKSNADLVVESNLLGLSSSLPQPFNKTATETLPFRFEKQTLPANGRNGAAREVRDQMKSALGRIASAQIVRRRANGHMVPERGAVAVGTPLALPDRGLAVDVVLPQLDLDFWRAALSTSGNGSAPAGEPARPGLQADRVGLRVGTLDAFGRQFRNVDLRATQANALWQLRLASAEANGELQFSAQARGALRARLRNLALEAPPGREIRAASAPAVLEDLPALDVIADNFSFNGKKFGRLELQARNEASNWRIDTLALANPDGRLAASGLWRMSAPQRTSLDFRLEAEDIGKLLERLGFAGAVRRGTATLSGKLGWAGNPTHIDYTSMDGEMRVEANKGQFARLDPGTAGKLLGLISLQSLPRRLTLDFGDIFSEGFAFDSISSNLAVKQGVMRTDRLQIDGPSARIVMKGEVDLERETQNMTVNVQPELGATAALGIALVHPVIGAATLVAHKLLQNPLNHLFSFDYAITGTWDDPKVNKLSTMKLPMQMGSPETGSAAPGSEEKKE